MNFCSRLSVTQMAQGRLAINEETAVAKNFMCLRVIIA
jgi:hypothetical protein